MTAREIREVAQELGLGEKVDPLIAELKATGVMSPRLGSLTGALKARAPIYELNPSLRPPSLEESLVFGHRKTPKSMTSIASE